MQRVEQQRTEAALQIANLRSLSPGKPITVTFGSKANNTTPAPAKSNTAFSAYMNRPITTATTSETTATSEESSQQIEEVKVEVEQQEENFYQHLNYLNKLHRETIHMQEEEIEEGAEGYEV